MKDKPKVIALIPARCGSKRLPGKNVRKLAGHPLIAYTITAALDSEVFDSVMVSTDSEEYAQVARYYGAEAPFLRPAELAGDCSPDIDWLEYTLTRLRDEGRTYGCFSILRPTSPFRLPNTIRRAWHAFVGEPGVDSLRAVEKCGEHPGKMWVIRGNRMMPLLPFVSETTRQPWHSSQYQSLPEVYIQNASLEIAWSRVVFEDRTIAGRVVVPFLTEGCEGLDVNRHYDWELAEELVRNGAAALPEIRKEPHG